MVPTIDLRELEDQLEIRFKRQELAGRVFIHRSYLNEHKEVNLESNERLEFLGDAVLELIVTEYLYHTFPDKEEGELTAIRSALVKREHLAFVAKQLDLGKYLLLSKGESLQGGQNKDYILANTMEALIGAVFLEHGYGVADRLVKSFILVHVQNILENKAYIDSKSLLQEKAQELRSVTPFYELVSSDGPDHAKEFEMGVYFHGELIATGHGSSKRKAEEEAAMAALQKLGWGE